MTVYSRNVKAKSENKLSLNLNFLTDLLFDLTFKAGRTNTIEKLVFFALHSGCHNYMLDPVFFVNFVDCSQTLVLCFARQPSNFTKSEFKYSS